MLRLLALTTLAVHVSGFAMTPLAAQRPQLARRVAPATFAMQAEETASAPVEATCIEDEAI